MSYLYQEKQPETRNEEYTYTQNIVNSNYESFETEEKGGWLTFYESGEVKSNNSISEVN